MKKNKSEVLDIDSCIEQGKDNVYFDLSILDQANQLLKQTTIPLRTIAQHTGLNFHWLENFQYNYKKGSDFHVRKVEKLIAYLSKNNMGG